MPRTGWHAQKQWPTLARFVEICLTYLQNGASAVARFADGAHAPLEPTYMNVTGV